MRVEFVSPYDHSPQTGIGRYMYTLKSYLGRSIEVSIKPMRFAPFSSRLSFLRNFPLAIDGHVPGSIVHFPQIMGCAMMLYRPYRPSVATVHDLGFLELPEEWEMYGPIARRLLRLSLAGLKRVDRIVADSEFTRQGVIKHLGIPEERVVTIYPGIDHELFRPIPNARETLAHRYPQLAAIIAAPWLLYVGSELPRKNVTTLLQAISLVREIIPDVQLIKVGSAGGERFRRETLWEIDKLGLKDNVLFFEGVAEAELPLFYNAADVFVTASKLEGFGFPVLEALACGTPVVCGGIGALPEIAGELALYCDPHDPSSISHQIRMTLARVNDRDRLACERIKHVARFDWGASAVALATLYERLSKEAISCVS